MNVNRPDSSVELVEFWMLYIQQAGVSVVKWIDLYVRIILAQIPGESSVDCDGHFGLQNLTSEIDQMEMWQIRLFRLVKWEIDS